CGAQFLGVFYCVSQDRLSGVFNASLSDAIKKIQSVISYARAQNPDLMIRYTPEDTVRSKYSNVLDAARGAVEAGADVISIADTTGHMIPHIRSMYDYVARLKEDLQRFNLHPKIAVHCHNDRGLALANALDGLRGGAEIIDASTMGLGERAGIVDLAQLVTALLDFAPDREFNLTVLNELYQLVSQYTGIALSPTAPIVGANAFTHCAGVHTHAAAKNPAHYESLQPELFGRTRSFSLDHMSGISSLKAALDSLEIEVDNDTAERTLREVKRIGESGRCVSLEELGMIVDWLSHHPEELQKNSKQAERQVPAATVVNA
ncbi:MAG: hypothetical protein KDD60_10590, partial [Bdellovibrionales bacterium]|nr:hypothetical protein [Bdellovibrionales bacterium]